MRINHLKCVKALAIWPLYIFIFSSTDGGLLRIRTQRQGGSRRTTFKRKPASKNCGKSVKRERDPSTSERLRENIRKFRTEERMLAVDPSSIEDECDGLMQQTSLDDSSMPQSPNVEASVEPKLAELTPVERWLKLETEVRRSRVCKSHAYGNPLRYPRTSWLLIFFIALCRTVSSFVCFFICLYV